MDDAGALYAYRSDPEVQRWDLEPRPWSEAECEEMLHRAIACIDDDPRIVYHLAIARPSGEMIGECILFGPAPCAGIGFILNRAEWGQGYGTEVARGLLRFGFTQLGMEELVAGCHGENLASQRVLERAGMRRDDGATARFETSPPPRGARGYVITRSEWLALESGVRQEPRPGNL